MKIFLANIVALIVLLGDFGSLHHFLVVKHKLCAIHGEFEHVTAKGGIDGPYAASLPDSDDQDDHDSAVCHHKHMQFKQPSVVAAEVHFELATFWDLLTPPARNAVYPSVAILHAAPKNSPPRFTA